MYVVWRGRVLFMSIEITITQKGLVKSAMPFDVIRGDLEYGEYDGLRLDPGKIGDEEFVLYNPSHIARGFSVVWTKSEKNQIYLRLPLPSCAEEIDDFYDTVVRIAGRWKNCSIDQDGSIIDLSAIPEWRESMKEYSLQALKQFCRENDGNLTLFCAFWPLVFGPDEKQIFADAADLSGYRDFLHEKQSVELYYAMPSFYQGPDGIFGNYTLTEDVESIFPVSPYVPFGVVDPDTNEPLAVPSWYVTFYSITKDEALGQISYGDFVNEIGSGEYYDAENIIIKPVPLARMEEIIQQFGIEL